MHIAVFKPRWLDKDAIPAEVVEGERETLTAITLNEGKPEHIVPKIVEGRLSAFYKENTLLAQDYSKDPSVTVGKVLDAEGASVSEFVRFQVGA